MRLHVEPLRIDDTTFYLALSGALVHGEESAGKFLDAVRTCLALDARIVRVDMSDIWTCLDAGGIGALVGAKAEADRAGARLELCNVQPQALQLLAICKLIAIFGPGFCKKVRKLKRAA